MSNSDRPVWVRILLDKSLTMTERTYLLYRAWRQGRNGDSWASQETVARELGISERQIRRISAGLEAKGRLKISWPDGPGRGHTKRYILTEKSGHRCPVLEPEKGTQVSGITDRKGDIHVREKGTSMSALYKNNTDSEHKHPSGGSVNGFDRFWAIWPKKVDKADARKVWRRIKPSEELAATIIAAVGRQKLSAQWTKDGGQYIPSPARWLRGEKWNDELPAAGGTATAAPVARGADGLTPLERARLAQERKGGESAV